MPDTDHLSSSLQESVLTLIAFNQEKGKMVAGLLSADLFEEPYRDIASRIILFHQRYGRAPGTEHIDDVFDHVLGDPDHKQLATYERILKGLLQQHRGLNVDYVTSRVTEFIRRQRQKAGILKAAQRYQSSDDSVADDVDEILSQILKCRVETMDLGASLRDERRALAFLYDPIRSFRTGIPEFDKRDIGPTRKEIMFLQGAKSCGKSWFLIDQGKQAVLTEHLKVLHLTLENSELRTMQRYHQSLFDIAKREGDLNETLFEFNNMGNLSGMIREKRRPRMSLDNPDVRSYLIKRRSEHGLKLGSLMIKEYASGTLTMQMLRSYLDQLDVVHHFIPDLILLDYADIMKLDIRDMRLSMGRNLVDLRGLASERNAALLTVKQSNREGNDAKKVTAKHAAEDFSAYQTADIALTYSQTIDEKILGLARLYVEKARNDEDKFTVIISQSYGTGQFCIGSARMISDYEARLKEFADRHKKDGNSDDEDEEE